MAVVPPEGNGTETLAQSIYNALGSDVSFTVPLTDLSAPAYTIPTLTYGDPVDLTTADLTSGSVGGTGVFDVMMSSVKAHLKEQFDKNRISGAEYARAYVELTTAAMSTATQFLLARDQSKWTAVQAKYAADRAATESVTARINNETAKAELGAAKHRVVSETAQASLVKMQLATADIQYELAEKQRDKAGYEITDLLPAQKAKVIKDTDVVNYQLTALLPAQKKLVDEQVETARAQTLDTRTDGVTVVKGSVGKQKELHAQQIDSYKKDSAYKAAKMYLDGWITQKTLNDALLPPTELENATVNSVLSKIRTNNNL